MKVLVAARSRLDLKQSHLNDEAPSVGGGRTVLGAALFDGKEQIVRYVSEYLTEGAKDSTLSFETLETYGRNLGYLIEHHQKDEDYSHLTPDEILLRLSSSSLSQYFCHLREVGNLAGTTIRNRDATYLAFYSEFLCVDGKRRKAYRADNPYVLGLFTPAPKRKLVQPCDPGELKELILCSQLERERCLLQFVFDAGLRSSEVGRVTLKSVKDALSFASTKLLGRPGTEGALPNYCPIFIEGSKGRGNNFKERYSLVSRPTLERIRKYHASPLYKKYAARHASEAVTPCFFNANGEAYTEDSFAKLMERVSERGTKSGRLSRMVSPHKLRHGNAYAILNSPDLGESLLDRMVIAQKSLGHSRLQTMETYTAIPQEIYNSLCNADSELKNRADVMAQLAAETRKRIDLSDKK